MSGIPVLISSGNCIARAWENSLLQLHRFGCEIKTQYDKPDAPPSKDATMLITIDDPSSEPMIHRDIPCGYEALQEYVMEVCEGIKDHWVDTSDPHKWKYTYHERLFGYDVPGLGITNQVRSLCQQLADTPYTRRAQMITWKVWEDPSFDDPACLQSVWCRITEEHEQLLLNMNVRFRSNDAYKAAMMNIFALVKLQELLAERISKLMKRPVKLGRYCHIADSYHIYSSNMAEFEARFLGALNTRSFDQRTTAYSSVRDSMETARVEIMEKVGK